MLHFAHVFGYVVALGVVGRGWACTKGQQFSIFRAEALYVVVFSVVWVGDTIGF